MAKKTNNPVIIAFAQKQVTLTDFVFTAGGSAILFITGLVNIKLHEISIAGTVWIYWALALFTLSGIIWITILIPLQIKQANEAKTFCEQTKISAEYWRREYSWVCWGILTTILPIISIILMVLKPS
jgi:uncharacterized membrane protein